MDAGYDAGFIASSLFAGRIICNIFWGYISDKIGRKLPIVVSATGLALSTLAFGFSTNFYWAVVTRFIQGCFMSLGVLCKSKLADVCDDTNYQLGYSILTSASSLGRMCGPGIAGFLVFPAEQYPNIFSQNGLFGKFPILLPMLVLVTGIVITNVFTILYLPDDTKREVCHYNEYNGDNGSGKEVSFDCKEHLSSELCTDDNEKKKDFVRFQIVETMSRDDDASCISCRLCCGKLKHSTIFRVLQTKEWIVSCILYGLYAFMSVGNNETFPLFATTAINVKGLGFTTSEVGIALCVASGILMTFQFTFQSKISIYFGPKRTLIISTLGLMFMFPILPCMALITNRYVLWFVLCIWLFITRVFDAMSNLVVNLFLKNSVTSDLLGSAIGLGTAVNSVGSMLSPSMYGSIYAWSLTNIEGVGNSNHPLGFPFNQYFIFFLQSAWVLFIAVLAARIPEHMEYKKENKCQDER